MSAHFWTTPDGRPGCPDCDWIAPPSFAGDDEPQTTVGLHRLAAHLSTAEADLVVLASKLIALKIGEPA